MSDEEFEDEPELDDEELDGDLDEDDVLVEDADEVADDVDLLDDEIAEESPEVPVPVVTDAVVGAAEEEDDEEGVVDLDEELHPDDVEAPLDTLLQERTASATLEDDEEELEEEEGDGDDRADGPARIVPTTPRRVPVPVVLPPAAAPSPRRSRAAVLRRLRLSGLRLRGVTPAAPVSGRTSDAAELELGAPRRRPRRRCPHRTVLPAGRARTGRARRAGPAAVGVARRAPGARRALRLRVRRRRVRGGDPVDPLLRVRRHRPPGRRDGAGDRGRRARWSPRTGGGD